MSIEKREHVMRLLAACFCEPEVTMYEEERFFENLRECISSFCPEAIPNVDRMEKAIQQYSEEDLMIEYARLFVGPYSLVAAPYGSVYLDEGGRIMGDSTMDVINWYEREGLMRSGDCKDVPDHIAIELEFMSFLMRKEMNAVADSDTRSAENYASKRRNFAVALLGSWIPEFCEKIRTGTDNEYYKAIADCMKAVASLHWSRPVALQQ